MRDEILVTPRTTVWQLLRVLISAVEHSRGAATSSGAALDSTAFRLQIVCNVAPEAATTDVTVSGHAIVPNRTNNMVLQIRLANHGDTLANDADLAERYGRDAESSNEDQPGSSRRRLRVSRSDASHDSRPLDDDIVAVDRTARLLFERLAVVAQSESPVLITGESGTGKEVIARRIYELSPRHRAKFVPVNCGAFPETLIESGLFGYRRGAFTGATTDKKGLIEEARNGVLFLDEIGDMPFHLQVRLLRFLDSGEVRRVGDTDVTRVDVRVIAATNRSPLDEISAGRFRSDLYYRLGTIAVHVPPLRERPSDIDALARVHLKRVAGRFRKSSLSLSNDALSCLRRYPWPGNIRELFSVIEGAAMAASDGVITDEELPERVRGSSVSETLGSSSTSVELERQRLLAVLEQCDRNRSRAAAALGISRTTLWRKLRRGSHPT